MKHVCFTVESKWMSTANNEKVVLSNVVRRDIFLAEEEKDPTMLPWQFGCQRQMDGDH
ncbi:MAG TPA: hypothetical protein PKY63_12470 [Bacteroidales bacterium]|nr:hypothetical protein [Bacteroidales bacterium]